MSILEGILVGVYWDIKVRYTVEIFIKNRVLWRKEKLNVNIVKNLIRE